VTPNAFVGRTKTPTEADLREALGAAKPVWDRVMVDMARELELTHEWKSYGPKFGWALRLQRGKRNIVHLGPCEASFTVLFILGKRAVNVRGLLAVLPVVAVASCATGQPSRAPTCSRGPARQRTQLPPFGSATTAYDAHLWGRPTSIASASSCR
jgi:hypothetical protein